MTRKGPIGPNKRDLTKKPKFTVGRRVAFQMKAEPALCGFGIVVHIDHLPNRNVFRYTVEHRGVKANMRHVFDEDELASPTDKQFKDIRQGDLDL